MPWDFVAVGDDTLRASDARVGGFLLTLLRGGEQAAALRADCDAAATAIGANS